MKYDVDNFKSIKQSLTEEISALESRLKEKRRTNIIEDKKYEDLKDQLTALIKRNNLVDVDELQDDDDEIIQYIEEQFAINIVNLNEIENVKHLLKKTLEHFSNGDTNDTINNLFFTFL